MNEMDISAFYDGNVGLYELFHGRDRTRERERDAQLAATSLSSARCDAEV